MVPDETNAAVTGLDEEELSKLQTLFPSYPEISKVILFGSRAKGTAKKNSTIESLAMDLDELPLPINFDLQTMSTINNNLWLEHIERVGIAIYRNQFLGSSA